MCHRSRSTLHLQIVNNITYLHSCQVIRREYLPTLVVPDDESLVAAVTGRGKQTATLP